MTDLVSVRFLTHQSPYNAGERAGFIPDVAKRYIAAGIAVLADAPEALSSHDMTVADVRKHVDTIDSIDELRVLLGVELEYPNTDGEGRAGAVTAIERRMKVVTGE